MKLGLKNFLKRSAIRHEMPGSELWQRLKWTARLGWQRVNWREFLAASLVVFALGVLLLINLPLHRDVQKLQAFLQAKELQQTQIPAAPSYEQPSEKFIADFLNFLPHIETREQQLQSLNALAEQSNVVIARIEFSHKKMETLPVRGVAMQLSVKAEYAAYRKFLNHMLTALPNLSLDRLSMARVVGGSDISGQGAPQGPGLLNVQMECTLLYRDGEHAVVGEGSGT